MTKKHLFFDVGGKRMKRFNKLIATFIAVVMCMLLVAEPVVTKAEDVAGDSDFEEDEIPSVDAKLYIPDGNGSYVQFDQSCVKSKKFVQGTDISVPVNVYSSGKDNGYYDCWYIKIKNEEWGYYIDWQSEHYDFSSTKGAETVTVTIPTYDFEPGTYELYVYTKEDVMNEDYVGPYEFEIIDPVIKGKCQMPYTGAGGGYLIGVETYEDNNYLYEMLILDCTLLRDGKDAWVYTTGKCKVPENCLWTIWQPQYGYYWTLFRVYDSSGVLLEEQCYGFVNAY